MVSLASNNDLLGVPAAVTVASGSTTASFTAAALAVTSNSTAVVTASLNGGSLTYSLTLAAPAVLSNLVCSPSTLGSNASSTCTVTLSAAAPSGGAAVTLASNSASLAVPATVTVPSGSTTANFTASASALTSNSTAEVTASLNGSTLNFSLNLVAPATISGFTCSPASLAAGESSTCTVTLSAAAPGGGATVALSANHISLTVPGSVTVPAGASTANFTATASTIASSATAVITATLNGSSLSSSIQLTASSGLTSLNCSPSTLNSGETSNCTVSLSEAAPGGGTTVSLSNSSTSLAVPANVTIPAGAATASFTATAQTITANSTALITATLNGASLSNSIILVAPTALEGLTCNPPSLSSGQSGSCTLSLLTAAPSGGATVSLSSNSPSLSVPQSVSIPAGAKSVNFSALASSVNSNSTALITATLNGGSVNHSVALVVLTTLSSVTCNPPSLNSGGSGTCTVTLGAPAPSGGLAVGLAKNNPLVNIPAAVTVPAGATSATFTANAATFTTSSTAVITATANGSSLNHTLQLVANSGLTGLSCAPSSINSNGNATCTVTLGGAAPGDGVAVSLADNSPWLSTPSLVTVPAGALSAEFTVTASTLTASSTAVITATSAGVSTSYAVNLVAPNGLSGLTCEPAILESGGQVSCTVTLSSAATTGGTQIRLSSSNPLLSMQPHVTIPARQSSATFSVKAATLTTSSTASIRAELGSGFLSYSLLLVAPSALTSLSCGPESLSPGSTGSCTLNLSEPAPGSGFTVAISANSPWLSLPPSVTVAPGALSASFPVTAGAFDSNSTATITASAAGQSVQFLIGLQIQVKLSQVTCTPASLYSNGAASCTLTLSAPAPSGGAAITLSRDSEALTIPATATIAAGETSVSFPATVADIETTATVTLTAALEGVSLNFELRLNAPATLESLDCTDASLTSGSGSLCTLTLAGPAPEGGTVVELTTDSPNLAVPVATHVAAGSQTAVFAATALNVTEEETAHLTASLADRTAEFQFSLAPASVGTVALARINVGGPDYIDSRGQLWSADTGSQGYVNKTDEVVTGTPDPALYMNERWTDNSPLEYRFPATPGTYNVRLKFAEIYVTEPGQRIFNILINGSMVEEYFDVLGAAGGRFKAIDKDFTVVSDGEIVIQLAPVLQNPKLNAIEITAAGDSECPCSIWDGNGQPSEVDTASTPAIELGLKFRATKAGSVTGVRFYKSEQNTGIHTGRLWSSGGALLASVVFEDESESGWQHANFPEPVPVEPGVTYVISYHAPYGHYSRTLGEFTGARLEAGPLQALKDGEDGPNGLFTYGSGFPTSSHGGANYWVDVVFMPEPEEEGEEAPSGLLSDEAPPPSLSLSCARHSVYAGDSFVCELHRNGEAQEELRVALKTSNSDIRVPVSVLMRAGQRTVTFRASVDEAAPYSTFRIFAGEGDHQVRMQLSVVAKPVPGLSLPGPQFVRPGEALRFAVVAKANPHLAPRVTVPELPSGAVFIEDANWFEWTPDSEQAREEQYRLEFHTGEADGEPIANTTRVQVEAGAPLITHPVQVVCSPGAIATLQGRWLSSRREELAAPTGEALELGGVRVLLNRVLAYGTPLPVLFASQTRVDFLCPDATGQDFLSLVLETPAGASAPRSIRSVAANPALLTLPGANKDHGFAMHAESRRIVTLRDARSLGEPARPGDLIVLRATGLGSTPPEPGSISVLIGETEAEVVKVTRSEEEAGIYLVEIRLPASAAAGDEVPVQLRLLTPGEDRLTSNTVILPLESAVQ